jgi:phage regulator Rha-like protein
LNLVLLKNNEPLTTSEIVSAELKRTHKSIINLVNTYKKDFEEFGTLSFSKGKSTGGRPLEFVYLNEQQLMFLLMNMKSLKKDGDKVLKFKKLITKEFFKMKKALLQIHLNQQNEEWIKTRKDGKKARKELTDAIDKLRETHVSKNPDSTYAKKPNLIYSNITRMIDKALFDIQVSSKAKRNLMTKSQLSVLDTAELGIAKKIYESIDNDKDAKETYKILQEEIKPYVDFVGGKTTIIDMITSNQISINRKE